MSDPCTEEVENTIRRAAQTGEILIVAVDAKRIAALCGRSPQMVAEELTQAGIRAGITMQFGAPDDGPCRPGRSHNRSRAAWRR